MMQNARMHANTVQNKSCQHQQLSSALVVDQRRHNATTLDVDRQLLM
jgi:hypothetical protein